MWQRFLFLLIFCLTTLTNGQQQPIDPPPMIINFLKEDLIGPEQVKFRIDDGFRLPCAASGSNLKWTWKHNDTTITPNIKFKISDSGTLIGSLLGSTESGDYQCFVEDTKTKKVTFSRKIKIGVTVVGKFLNPVDVEKDIELGQEFSFACPPHKPSYGVSFSWQGKTSTSDIQFKRDERVAISPTTGDLFIMYVLQEDINTIAEFENKGIRCTITGANVFQRSGLLKLRKKTPGQTDPDRKTAPGWRYSAMSKAHEIAVEGRNKTLYCLAVGRPVPKIIWKKNGVRLVTGKDSYEIANAFQGRLLNIVNVNQKKHEDFYSCEAENTESRGIPLVHSINLVVKVPPKWTGDPPKDKKTIEINGNGTITCNVFGIPNPSITWYKDGGRILTATNNLKVDDNKLHFKDTRLDENGVYQCVAENIYGMIVSSTWVEVLAVPPSFDNGFGPFYLFNESEGRLKCSPKAAPPPSEFIWSKDGKELKTSPYRVEPDGTLVIDKVVPERDQGTYKCYAKNLLGDAFKTAFATVLARTKIIIAPQNKTVEEGMRVDLRCEAEYDKTLELVYCWYKDKALIRCQKDDVVLTLPDITVDDAGIYTCEAKTPQPKKSEDSASAIINIAGVPYPPSSLKITDCFNRTTTLSWITGAANDASIMHFLIEQESTYEPNVFRVIANVTNPNATSVSLNLTGWATLRFRVRSVNRFGPSRASIHTTEYCVTDVGVPDTYPDDYRGVPKKAEELDIAWTAMPKVDWNAPGLYYILKYRSLPNGAFVTEIITDSSVDVFAIPNPGYYKPWEFQIQAGNDIGLGPKSPIVKSFSGQDPPAGRPEDVTVGAVGARSVELSWKPVTVTRGSVDGYRIYYWGESRIHVKTKRRRRAIPSNAIPVNVPGGSTQTHTVTGITPFSNYNMVIVAYNSGGEGPPSSEVFVPTEEAEPGPPSNVQVYPFAKYILVTWNAPLEPNGIIINYRVGSEVYPGPQPSDDLAVDMQEVGLFLRKLLGDQTPEKNYVVKIQAQTIIGRGDAVIETTRTVKFSPPAKPERPTVIGTAVDAVEVTYNFGLGGGYTHEFKVMYRRQVAGEEFQNTIWVNHFDTQSIEIGDLSPELYEFKTVGRNDYPGTSESPESDITEARPLPGVVNAGQRGTTPIHKAAWFIALLVLIAILLIVLLVFIAYTRHQGAKYPVGKRERKRAALIDREPYDEEEGAFSNAGRTENPPPYQSEGSLQKSPESDRDSLDDYGEGPQFNEDGSFIAEYGDEKKPAPDEKDESAFATFV